MKRGILIGLCLLVGFGSGLGVGHVLWHAPSNRPVEAPAPTATSDLKRARAVLEGYLQACLAFGARSPGAQERLSERFRKQQENSGMYCTFTAYGIATEKVSPDRNDEAAFIGTVEATGVTSWGPVSDRTRGLNPASRVGFKARMVKPQEGREWRVDSIEYQIDP